MTILKCSAHNCYYNKDSLCSKGAINVEGADARYADANLGKASVCTIATWSSPPYL